MRQLGEETKGRRKSGIDGVKLLRLAESSGSAGSNVVTTGSFTSGKPAAVTNPAVPCALNPNGSSPGSAGEAAKV